MTQTKGALANEARASGALDQLRDQILLDPALVLDDQDMMKALISAKDGMMGDNIVDLRGVAMDRLEERFDRLEDTHRSVIAAAYENLAGTKQVQRAVLALLEPLDFSEFLTSLKGEVALILKVDDIRLCLESHTATHEVQSQLNAEYGDVLGIYGPGSVEEYLTEGRNMTSRAVTLRQISNPSAALYGDRAPWIKSEALLKLDLGPSKLPGMLALAAEDPHQFQPNQGTDLLAFLAGAMERTLRRWLQ